MNTHLLPLAGVYLLGAWVLWPLGWYVSLAYAALVVSGNLVFICAICACCASYGRPTCASGYGPMSARLVRQGRREDYPARFRRYIPVVAAGWAVPFVGGLLVMWLSRGSARDLAFAVVALLVFSVVAFVVLPWSSRQSCARCPQRRDCPGARFTLGGRRDKG